MVLPVVNTDPREPPERLLERYLAGDDPAFAALVGRYENKLYAFILRLTGDPHLAEDVFQQTFINVAKNAASFDGRASFSTWLYRIARNAAMDELRRRLKRPSDAPAESLDFSQMPDKGLESPLDKLTREELEKRVRAALMRLPESQREAFLLKEEGDLDFGAIGEILGCGRETAKSRFRLAVGKLRTLLDVVDNKK